MDLDLIPAKEDFLHPIIQSNIERRKSKIGKESDVGEGLIEPSAKSSDNDDLFGIQFNGTAGWRVPDRSHFYREEITRWKPQLP